MNSAEQSLMGVLENLRKLAEEKGVPKEKSIVDKNIIKSEKSTFDSDKKKKALSRVDKAVLVDAFTLFNKMFFDYQKTLKLPPPLPKEVKKTPLPPPRVTINQLKDGKPSATEKRREWVDKFNLFNQMFFDYKKKIEPDTVEKTKVSNLAVKQTQPPVTKTYTKKDTGFGLLGMVLSGLSLLIGGIAAFISGITSDGPFKGILKLLSRVGLSGGMKVLLKAVKPFTTLMGKILKYPLKIVGSIGKFLGGGISKVFGKITGKLGGGTLTEMVTKFIKPLAKVFKRIPVIGTIISIAFAYSRFKAGDVVGGVIDTLSGLAGLVDIVAPGVGTTMSIGLDVLNAVLDSKSDQGPGKPKKNKLNILSDMAKSAGSWIWSNRMYIPVLSSVNRFMMAWDDFKAGNISSGFGNFGLALSNLITGVDGKVIMDGISGFMGLFDGNKETSTAPKPSKSFISEMSDVLSKSIKELWEWIKKKIKDGIASMVPGGKATLQFAEDAASATKELSEDIKNKSKEAYSKTKAFIGNLWGGSSDYVEELISPKKDDNSSSLPTPSVRKVDKLNIIPVETKTTNNIIKDVEKVVVQKTEIRDKLVSDNKNKIPIKNNTASVLVKDDKIVEMGKIFYKLNLESNYYLKIIANNTAMMNKSNNNSNNGTVTPTVIVSPPQQQSNSVLVNMPNNRDGFGSSMYSLA